MRTIRLLNLRLAQTLELMLAILHASILSWSTRVINFSLVSNLCNSLYTFRKLLINAFYELRNAAICIVLLNVSSGPPFTALRRKLFEIKSILSPFLNLSHLWTARILKTFFFLLRCQINKHGHFHSDLGASHKFMDGSYFLQFKVSKPYCLYCLRTESFEGVLWKGFTRNMTGGKRLLEK